eukprot:scaffold198539_cov58-Attheya_sp.AAC.1
MMRAPLGGGGCLREPSGEQRSPSELHLVPVLFSLPVSAARSERRSPLGWACEQRYLSIVWLAAAADRFNPWYFRCNLTSLSLWLPLSLGGPHVLSSSPFRPGQFDENVPNRSLSIRLVQGSPTLA